MQDARLLAVRRQAARRQPLLALHAGGLRRPRRARPAGCGPASGWQPRGRPTRPRGRPGCGAHRRWLRRAGKKGSSHCTVCSERACLHACVGGPRHEPNLACNPWPLAGWDMHVPAGVKWCWLSLVSRRLCALLCCSCRPARVLRVHCISSLREPCVSFRVAGARHALPSVCWLSVRRGPACAGAADPTGRPRWEPGGHEAPDGAPDGGAPGWHWGSRPLNVPSTYIWTVLFALVLQQACRVARWSPTQLQSQNSAGLLLLMHAR